MAYKHIVRCPLDNTKLRSMVASTTEYETYHCLDCDTYWHVYWYKYRTVLKSGFKWRISKIRDDFGKLFSYAGLAANQPPGAVGRMVARPAAQDTSSGHGEVILAAYHPYPHNYQTK